MSKPTKATGTPIPNIRARRLHLGLSIRTAAQECGLSPSTFHRLEQDPSHSQWALVVAAVEGLGGRVDVMDEWWGTR